MIFSTGKAFGRVLVCALSILALLSGVDGLTPAQWRSQSIYQVLTDRFALSDGSTTEPCNLSEYCGGSWRGIINQLSYIQEMGFTAIWISPITEQIYTPTGADGNSYHGYWPKNIYETNSYFGPASHLIALSDALHARGMYLMVDVVPNHMAYDGCGECVNYTGLYPFNEQSYFHPFCLIDSDNATSVEVCWEGDNIVALPDLRTESTTVVKMFQTWIKQLVANYTIDGLRIDSGLEMDLDFFTPFQDASGVFNMAEVLNGNEWEFCTYQNYVDGALNYPAYFWIVQAFESTTGSISNLAEGLEILASQCSDTTLLGSFIENHDQPRFPSLTSDMALTKNAIGFSMLMDGIPIIYQGQEQHYSGIATPENREDIWSSGYNTNATLYTYITLMNKIRDLAIKADSGYVTDKSTSVYTDSNTIVMRKGSASSPMLSVFNNRGATGNGSFLLTSSASGFGSEVSVTDLVACKTHTTDSSGNLNITVTNGQPQVYYLSSLASAICPSSSNSVSPSSSSTKTSAVTSKMVTISTKVTNTKPTTTTTSTSSCATSTSRPIAFEVDVTNMTSYSFTNVKLVGSVPALYSWNTSAGIPLKYDNSSECDIYWYSDGAVELTPGTVVEYKYINIYPDGYVEWEADPNHSYTVPSACSPTAVPTITDTWQKA